MSKRVYKIQVRLKEEEFTEIEQKRASCHMTLSEFVRARLFNGDNLIYYDPALREDVQHFIYEINKIGVNVNQIAASVNSKGFSTEKDLSEIKKYLNLVFHIELEIEQKLIGGMNGDNETA